MEMLKGINGVLFLAGALAAGAAGQALFPWRRIGGFSPARWLRGAALTFYSALLVQFLPFLSAYGAALFAEENRVGLFNIAAPPLFVQVLAAIAVFDLLAFAQHRALHRWRFLWRAHRLHHTDSMVETTTALRFHPFESVFRAAIDVMVVAIAGLPPEGVLFSFAVMAIANVETHTNINLPLRLEMILSRIFITPRAHRLHHSIDRDRYETNFGTLFSIWDRLSNTFIEPSQLNETIRFGLPPPEALPRESFALMIIDPFRNAARQEVRRGGGEG